MFTLTKTIRFEAAHKLPHHDGKCARLHGHSFVAHIICRGDQLKKTGPKQGMLLDFKTVSAAVAPLVEDKLDHHFLNETLPMENPTSEEVAAWLYDELEPKLLELYAVEIEETCTSKCRYCPSEGNLLGSL